MSAERVEAELEARKELATIPDILHGGAIMALADNLGGVATVAICRQGARTATIESKTNFFAAIPVGETARAECTPLHRGRTTMVWQTQITRNDGRLCAMVIQTQIVIPAEKKHSYNAGESFRRGAERVARAADRAALARARMGFAPDRNRRFQTPRARLREPDRAAALIVLRNRDFDEPGGFQAAQIARQGRLIEPGAPGERAERVVGGRRDLRHQAELREAESAAGACALRGNW